MKKFSRLFLIMTVLIATIISACGGSTMPASETSAGSSKPLASLIEVNGFIEAIDGNQWTINGQVVTVDSSMVDDDDLGDYQVGDYVEIEAEVSVDGSLIAREVDSSDDGNENDDTNSNDDELGGIGNSNDDNSNSNDDDSNSNDDDSNSNDDDSNSNDDDSNSNDDDSNSNDDDSNSNDDEGSNSNDDDDSNSNDDDDSSSNDDDSNDNDDEDNENDG